MATKGESKPVKAARKSAKPAPKKVAAKKAPGRPTLYKEEYAEQARKYCLLGATDRELAELFEVNEDTIHEWKKVHPAFSESVKKGKAQADANVADRLYQRALGYEHPEIDIRVVNQTIVETPITKIYPPDPTAAIFWLKNRQKAKWRDRQELEHSGKDGGPITIKNAKDLTDDELAAIAARSSARTTD